MDEFMHDLVKAVRAHAEDHYDEGGWDYVVEAYDDEYLIELIGDAANEREAIAAVGKVVAMIAEVRSDIQSTAF